MRRLRGRVDYMAVAEETVNEYGIPKDADEAKTAVENKSLKVLSKEEADKVSSGRIVEGFSITVKDDNGTYFESKNQPFGWTKVDSLAGVLESEGGELTDDAISFLGEALSGEKNGKAVKALVEVYNAYTRGNAKGAEYQRILNAKLPISEESKGKKRESMINLFMLTEKVSREKATETLKVAMPGLFQ